MKVNLDLAEPFLPLLEPWRYIVLHGGRGGAKTTAVSDVISGVKCISKPLNIVCAREFQNSMEESVKTTLEESIAKMELDNFYEIQNNKILGKNGTVIRFKGLSRNIMSIKAWHNVDLVWIEEANTLSKASMELLIPTIRKPGSQIIFTMNRHRRDDPVDERFIGGSDPDACVVKVGWQDNPWFPAELETERLKCKENEPDRYPHIWEGEPDDQPDGKVIVPYAWLQECIDAHIKCKVKIEGPCHAGLDAADGGNDPWGYVRRRGPLILDTWAQKGEAWEVVPRANSESLAGGVVRVFYDAIGVGAAVKSEVSKFKHTYKLNKYIAGGKIQGKDRYILKGVKNKDFFSKFNAQCWWNLRLRCINTRKLLRGEKVNPAKCLFFDSKIESLDKLLLELSQALYDYDASNRIKIIKAPDDAASPNMADACTMAFAYDCRRGLKA